MKELRRILEAFAGAREHMALATIVRTTGSSYRKPGARMLIFADGQTVGTLSGGCIEEEIAQRALPVIASGVPELFPIDTLKRFGCHGTIEVFVERIEPGNAFLKYVAQCFAKRQPARVAVVFENSPLRASYPQELCPAGMEGFQEIIAPPVRLVIFGDSAGTDELLCFSRLLGWDAMLLERPDAMTLEPDARTAVIVKNHHFGRDFAALQCALPKPFGYIGLLGSRRRKSELLNALMTAGLLPVNSALHHFYGPAGLDVGAESPDEIALSIVAEIQAAMANHGGGFLRDCRRPIHEVAHSCTVALH